MADNIKAMIFEECGKLLSSTIRTAILKPGKSHVPEQEEPSVVTVKPKSVIPIEHHTETYSPPLPAPALTQEELDYRFECCLKHLGGANVLLREAYERAIDDGVGESTAEKIMEAMNEHSGMEADLEKMLPIPEAREQAEKLMSGVRAFRAAAWKAKLTTGGGTKGDIADARLWNDILYTEAFNSAKSHPGSQCVTEGM